MVSIEMMGMNPDVSDNSVVFREARKAEVGQPVVCPVMGTKFKVKQNTEVADYKGKSYYFCCGGCPRHHLRKIRENTLNNRRVEEHG